MKAVMTALIAAIEAMAVALAVFAVVSIASALLWWLQFDLEAAPETLVGVAASVWSLVHLVPVHIEIPAQQAIALGLAAEDLQFAISLAPLGLTLVTVLLAFRSGRRLGARGDEGISALIGGALGFSAAAAAVQLVLGANVEWSLWAAILVPTLVYVVPMLFGFVVRAASEAHGWWLDAMKWCSAKGAAMTRATPEVFTDRVTEVVRLTIAGVTTVFAVAGLGVTVAILFGFVDIVTLGQRLQLDIFGSVSMFVLHLLILPVAWIWAISWFAGSGFAIGTATSVSPFETLLGPMPALPLFGAIPDGWGWAGAFAPVLLIAAAAAVGGLFAGQAAFRNASAWIAAAMPLVAAVLVGRVVVALSALASGSIGPGRLEETGPAAWLTGGLVALEVGFGMSLGVFARRVDLGREGGRESAREVRLDSTEDLVEVALSPRAAAGVTIAEAVRATAQARAADATGTAEIDRAAQTVPVEPLPDPAPGQEPKQEPKQEPELEPRREPDPEPEQDPLLAAYSWESRNPDTAPRSMRDLIRDSSNGTSEADETRSP